MCAMLKTLVRRSFEDELDVASGRCHYSSKNPATVLKSVCNLFLSQNILLILCILVPDSYIGAVSSSMFAGMMLGAVGWGTCSSETSLTISDFTYSPRF